MMDSRLLDLMVYIALGVFVWLVGLTIAVVLK